MKNYSKGKRSNTEVKGESTRVTMISVALTRLCFGSCSFPGYWLSLSLMLLLVNGTCSVVWVQQGWCLLFGEQLIVPWVGRDPKLFEKWGYNKEKCQEYFISTDDTTKSSLEIVPLTLTHGPACVNSGPWHIDDLALVAKH